MSIRILNTHVCMYEYKSHLQVSFKLTLKVFLIYQVLIKLVLTSINLISNLILFLIMKKRRHILCNARDRICKNLRKFKEYICCRVYF